MAVAARNHPRAAQVIRQQVIGGAVLRIAGGGMTQRVVKTLFEVAVAIVGGQQRSFVLPQIAFDDLPIFELGYAVAQSIVLVLDGVIRRLHLLESALTVVIVGGDFRAGGFLAEAAVAIVGFAGVALTF